MAIALVSPFLLPKLPQSAKWLNPEERAYLQHRITAEQGHFETDRVTMRSITQTLSNWPFWLHALMYCFNTSTAYANAFFIPTILTVSCLQQGG